MTKQSIELEWSEPVPYSEVKYANYPGFYCITTEYMGQPSRLIYIGHSRYGAIQDRLAEHCRNWFNRYRGIRISVALLFPDVLDKLSDEDMLAIENALIYAYGPEENKQGKDYLKYEFAHHLFLIENTGPLPYKFTSDLDMTELLLDPKPIKKKSKGSTSGKNTKKRYGIAVWNHMIKKKKGRIPRFHRK